ncbi:DUF4827 family protein [Dysgonomonas sp. 25]|uniref:DUF4827 family protein n=1 Tax=Dysgonomonas sp. 25 TaxID=2302933 RepID=UPI0013D027F3|nr:DUF4827 family protein [Dysgonomonas sp. 25]NDV68308.1 DUF4827 family protein [Dysgonomonas sp. 25]
MRKTCLFILAAFVIAIAFSACNKRDTYADKLKKERKAISRFISDHDIDILYTYPADGVFAENEFFKDENTGVYFRIRTKGNGDTIKERNRLSLRTDTLNIFLVSNDTLLGNNVSNSIFHTKNILLTYGNENTYTTSSNDQYNPEYWFKSAGCVLPLTSKYGLRDRAEVSILIPFSSGSAAQQSGYEPLYIESLIYTIID